MNDHPLVSIIIPCYNSEGTVGEAIESALAQTYHNVEVLVIDDCSTDSSLSVVNRYSKVVCLESKTNRGACASRNSGLALAKGELIQFLDADDILLPSKLEIMVPIAIKYGEEYIATCNWHEQGLERGTSPRARRISYTDGDPFLWCLFHSLQTSSPIHWRTNLLAVNGFNESLPRCQEYDLHLRLFSNGKKLFVVDQSLFLVRRQQGSLSSDYSRILREHPGILMRLRAHLQNHNALTADRNHFIAAALARGACHLAQRGQWDDARTLFLTAEAVIPGGKYLGFHQWGMRFLARFLSPAKTEWAINFLRKLSQ